MQKALYADHVFQIIETDTPWGLRLIGQADFSHRSALELELRRATRSDGDLHIDMSDLEFIDVGSVRLLVDTAGVLALDGRKLVISSPRPGILRSLRICGWDANDDVTVIDGGVVQGNGEVAAGEPEVGPR